MKVIGRALAVFVAMAFLLSGFMFAPASVAASTENLVTAESWFYGEMSDDIREIYAASQPNDYAPDEVIAVLFSDNELEGQGDVKPQVERARIDGEIYHIYARVLAGGRVLVNVYEQSDTRMPVTERGQGFDPWEFDPSESASSPSATPTQAPLPEPLSSVEVQKHIDWFVPTRPGQWLSEVDITDMLSPDGVYRYAFEVIHDDGDGGAGVLVSVYDRQTGALLNDGMEGDWTYAVTYNPVSSPSPTPTRSAAPTRSQTPTSTPTSTPTRSESSTATASSNSSAPEESESASPTSSPSLTESASPTASESASSTPTQSESPSSSPTESSASPSPTSKASSDLIDIEVGDDNNQDNTPWWNQPIVWVGGVIIALALMLLAVMLIRRLMRRRSAMAEGDVADDTSTSPFLYDRFSDSGEMNGNPSAVVGDRYASPMEQQSDFRSAKTPEVPRVEVWDDDPDNRR